MAQPDPGSGTREREIQELLESLERRITRIESHLGLAPRADSRSGASHLQAVEPEDSAPLDLRFGEVTLAWVGSIIFLLGIVFLMAYTISLGHNTFASLLGYAATAGFYLLARTWKASLPHISRVLISSSVVLLYVTTVRLHYFTAEPLITSRALALVLLLGVLGLQLRLALLQRSQWLAGLTLTLGFTTALLSDTTHFWLPMVAGLSAMAVLLAVRRGWRVLLNLAIPLAYGSYLLWLMNNPVLGRPLRAVTEHEYSLVYLFLWAVIFAWPTLSFTEKSSMENASIVLVGLNCIGFPVVVSLAAFGLFRERMPDVYLAAAALLLVLSAAQWVRTHSSFAPSVFACFGYLVLSVAIYGFAGIPNAYFWLALQSLLVVSMALWFGSKLLVVANSLIFIGILVAYLLMSPSSDLANFSFALVALASARIMNWQKERLTLRTKNLRNLYLIITFVFVLYSIYHAVPGNYVTLSWTVAGVGYFLLSLLLRNIKYRWMAIGTIVLAIFYLFLVDLGRLSPQYRVAAFLFLGLIALGLSLFYTKFRKLLGGR